MADKQISDLTSASALTDGSLFVLEQAGAAKKANWGMMKNYLSPGIAVQYSTSKTYAVGDYCIYNDTLKRCIVPITTPESYTAAHWASAVIGDEVVMLRNAFDPDNAVNLLSLVPMRQGTSNGVTYRWDGETMTMSGTSNSSGSSCNIWFNTTPYLPKGIAPGDVLDVRLSGMTPVIRYNMAFYNANDEVVGDDLYRQASYKITVPSSATHAKIRIWVTYNTVTNTSVSVKIIKYPTNKELDSRVGTLENEDYIINALGSNGEYTYSSGDWEKGTWSYSVKAANGSRLRTKCLIPIRAGTTISYDNPTIALYIGVLSTRDALSYSQASGWLASGGSGNYLITSNGYLALILEGNSGIDPSDYDCTIKLSSKLLDKFIYQGKNKSYNIPAGLTQWWASLAGWTPSSDPKLSPLDMPVNCYGQVNGDIMDTTNGVWFPGVDVTKAYFVISFAFLPNATARYYIVFETRRNYVWHGVKSVSENFVRWSNDSGFANDFAKYVPLQHVDYSASGFTWTWSNSGCYVIGSNPVPSGGIVCNLLAKQVLPDYVRAGERVYVEYETSNPAVFLRIITYDSSDNATVLPIITDSRSVTIPANAVKWLIRLGSYVGNDLSAGVLVSKASVLSLQNIDKVCHKTLKVLFIGNSYTHDCAEYFPFIFKNIAPGINLTCGIAYRGGASIDGYLNWFNSNDAVINYAKYRNNATKWDRIAAVEVPSDEKTIKQILADEPWDIITVQQASLTQGTWSSFSNLNDLLKKYAEYIRTTWGKSVKIGYLMPQLRYTPDSTPNYPVTYSEQQSCVSNLWQTTPIDFVIPCGTAIENARGNSTLNAIGNGAGGNTGHLVCDNGGHLQQGIGELIPNYVVVAKMLELCGEPLGILGNPIRPTDDVITAWDVPGKHDSTSDTSQGVTDANCYLAQRCALAAIKFPSTVSIIA